MIDSMSLARALIEAETGADTLVVHLDDRSTDFLRPIYEGKGYPVISGPIDPQRLMNLVEAHAHVYLMGHGSPNGLFARSLLIGREFGPLLASKKDSLFIWCNADAYAVKYKLSGLVSGMFISEVGEAALFGITVSQDEIDASNNLFAKTLRELIDTGQALSKVREGYSHATCQVVKFNRDRLYIFENGTPSPALHSTSLGNPQMTDRYNQPKAAAAKRLLDLPVPPEWMQKFNQAAADYGFDLGTLSAEERRLIDNAYLDDYIPYEVLSVLLTNRQGREQ